MSTVDPRSPTELGDALVAVAAERFGQPVALAEPASAIGEGFASHIVGVTLTGAGLPESWRRPLVLRLLPEVRRMDQARAEADVQRWCAQQGYPVPELLAVLEPDEGFGLPAHVMQRVPGVTVLDALKAKPWRVASLMGDLVALHLRLHALPTDGWPASTEPLALVDKRLGLSRRVVAGGGPTELADALDAVAALAPIAVDGPMVVCHGDFHPLNVVVDGPKAVVIDWTDAGLGPREADVSRTVLLFRVAALAAEGRVDRLVLGRVGPVLARRYRRAYERSVPLDARRMLAWEALHAVHGWAQVHTVHAGGVDGTSSAEADEVPAALAEFFRRRVEHAVAELT